MTIPDTTDQWLKKSEYDVDWNVQGGMGTSKNFRGDTIYGPSDGINDALIHKSDRYFNATNTSGITKCSMGFWFNKNDIFGEITLWFFSQVSSIKSRHTWSLGLPGGGGGTHGQIFFAKGPSIGPHRAVNTVNDYDDGVDHHVMAVWDEGLADDDELSIYVDGVEDSGAVRGAGTTSAWPASFTTNSYIYRREDNPDIGAGLAHRHKIWLGTALTAEQVLEEYNKEITLRSEEVIRRSLLLLNIRGDE